MTENTFQEPEIGGRGPPALLTSAVALSSAVRARNVISICYEHQLASRATDASPSRSMSPGTIQTQLLRLRGAPEILPAC
jgi:hypothetical protein